jgi:hypothetical protein
MLALAVAAALSSLGPAPTTMAAGLPYPLLELPELCTFSSTGHNPFFILEPGYTLELAGEEDGEPVHLTITVTTETKVVTGVETRVVIEEQTVRNKPEETSFNYFAQCQESGSVFYFGEDVDIYENGQVVSHEGAWLAGQGGARPGVMMPGNPSVGMVHFQEIAPLVAMDTGIVLSTSEHVDVPAGSFDNAVEVAETTPLEPGTLEYKWYARDVGLLVDGTLQLVGYGFR